MDKRENRHLKDGEVSDPASDAAEPNLSRRRFTRNMVAGSAVLATLANRSAWGNVTNTADLNCISGAYWWSYIERGTMPSHFTRGGGQDALIEAIESDLNNPGYEVQMVGGGEVCAVPPDAQGTTTSTLTIDNTPSTLTIDDMQQ